MFFINCVSFELFLLMSCVLLPNFVSMIELWPNYGRTMVERWSDYGRTMVELWSNNGRTVPICTDVLLFACFLLNVVVFCDLA